MGLDTLVDKLVNLVIDEKKLVTYKSACSFLDVDCSQAKVLLKTLLEARPHLEATWVVSGIEKESKILKYWFATTDMLTTTKSKLTAVKEEHVYSLRLKPDDKSELWNSTQDISEAHYKTDLNTMQNVWLDRENFMSDQILLDHRYSSVRGLDIERTAVTRSNNLCSPARKKRTRNEDINAKPSEKSDLPVKRGSKEIDIRPKKRAKTNSLGDMFSKAKQNVETQEIAQSKTKKKLIFDATTKEKPVIEETTQNKTEMQKKLVQTSSKQSKIKEKPASSNGDIPQKSKFFENVKIKPKVAEPKIEHKKPSTKKKGLFGFFSATTKSNPFDAYKKEKSKKSQLKRNVKKVKKTSKKKAVKKKSYEASTKPKRRAPEKKTPNEEIDFFADEESEEENNTYQQEQLEQQMEEEEELEKYQEIVLRNRQKPKKSMLSDSDSDSGADKPETPKVVSKAPVTDSASEDEKPTKISAKERRALRKAEEEKRRKELLISRKNNFWGAAKGKLKAKKKKMKTRTRSYVDPISNMLVTEEIEETDEEAEAVAA